MNVEHKLYLISIDGADIVRIVGGPIDPERADEELDRYAMGSLAPDEEIVVLCEHTPLYEAACVPSN